jgi:carboxyl-terminal processing protease
VWKDTATKINWRHTLVRRIAFLLVVLALMLAAYMYGLSQSPAGISAEDKESVGLYAEALDIVKQNYVGRDDIEPKKQTYSAIKGMLGSLDDGGHSRFLTPEETEQNREVLSSKYVGVGIRLEDKDDKVVVVSIIDGSPAEETGIKPGDVLVAVDGESVRGKDGREISEKVRGPEGTRVELTVLRDEEEREFSLERTELETPAASWNLIPGTDVVHLRLSSFSENSAAKLSKAISEAQKAGAKGIVLDLRDNSGGLVEQADEVAALFLPARSEIYTRKDAEESEEEATVPSGNKPVDAPLVVLVNTESASSAEILAGALKDNDRARIVGEKTFGAGTVLKEYALEDGSSILLGVAEWLTPNGNSIRGSGISPDVEAKLKTDQKPLSPDEVKSLSKEEIFEQDAQLKRAFEDLQQKE